MQRKIFVARYIGQFSLLRCISQRVLHVCVCVFCFVFGIRNDSVIALYREANQTMHSYCSCIDRDLITSIILNLNPLCFLPFKTSYLLILSYAFF